MELPTGKRDKLEVLESYLPKEMRLLEDVAKIVKRILLKLNQKVLKIWAGLWV